MPLDYWSSLEGHWSQTEIARVTIYLIPCDWVELTFMNSLLTGVFDYSWG